MADKDALDMLRLAKTTALDEPEVTYGLIDNALSILESEEPPALVAAQAGFDAAHAAYSAGGSALRDAAMAWIKAKVLALHPEGVTLVMVGDAGEDYSTTFRADRVLDANGDEIADLNDRDDTHPDDGPCDWGSITDLLPELDGPDGYMGEHEIDLSS